MSELSYKHDPDNGLIELMVNKEIIATWVCDGGDPEVEFTDFKKIYHAGQASAVMTFVNTQIGAFESSCVDTNEVSLYSLYRFAQHHIMDNYGVKTKPISEQWGKELAKSTKTESELKCSSLHF